MPKVRVLPDGKELEVPADRTLLQADLAAGVPHVHACGGHARCTTCRVLVTEGLESCAPRNEKERALAERLKLPPDVRLACQTRVTGPAAVRRLVLDEDDAAIAQDDVRSAEPCAVGAERRLAVLFADVRGFTGMAAALPAYDVVHILNRHFLLMGREVAACGGTINNYMGDGLMALFGLEDPDAGPLQSVRAALGMLKAVERLRPHLKSAYGLDFRIGVGVHAGEVVVGSIGAHGSRRLTAIGDVVNLASRIESANKEAGTSLLISEDLLAKVRDRVELGRRVEVRVKGLTGQHRLYEVVGLRG